MEKRECVVKDKRAIFYMFEQYSKTVSPSLMIGENIGGVTAEVFAVVEYEDGTVGRASLSDLRFTDLQGAEQAAERGAQQPKQRRKPTEEKTKCKYCKNANNTNAVIYADTENKEYFVYCNSCGIETIETFKSQRAAVQAFENGETIFIKEVKK